MLEMSVRIVNLPLLNIDASVFHTIMFHLLMLICTACLVLLLLLLLFQLYNMLFIVILSLLFTFNGTHLVILNDRRF